MDERKGNSTKSLLGDEKIKKVYNQTILTSAIQGELCYRKNVRTLTLYIILFETGTFNTIHNTGDNNKSCSWYH